MDQPQALWLVAERYFVGSVVGRGGYGMVCRGVDRKTGQQVALKMLSPEAGRDRDAVERMLREQQALVALSGTCAVTAIDLCQLESGAPCLVMEWLEGRDLEQQLSEWEAAGQRGDHELLLSVFAAVTDTLDRAHAIGIVHRDIKPANIFLTSAPPGARLLDFGLARMKSAAPLTAAGVVMGSPSYIPPETWRGNSAEIDGRADLFSLAVIAFRWLTGKLPFDAPDLVGKMLAVTGGPRPSAVALDATLTQAVDAWVARALAIDPAARFQSGQELYDALTAALKGTTAPKPKPAIASKPRPLVDAQQAFAAAFRAASELLKRFALPVAPKPNAPTSSAPVDPQASAATSQAPAATAPPAEPQASTGQRNTVWLDSSELVPLAAQRNTVWLDSNELVPLAAQRNTVWLDSSELSEAPPQPSPATEPQPVDGAVADSDASAETPSTLTPAAVTKTKRRMKTRRSKAKPVEDAARVSARKRRKGLKVTKRER